MHRFGIHSFLFLIFSAFVFAGVVDEVVAAVKKPKRAILHEVVNLEGKCQFINVLQDMLATPTESSLSIIT
jgi:hypothetical protein